MLCLATLIVLILNQSLSLALCFYQSVSVFIIWEIRHEYNTSNLFHVMTMNKNFCKIMNG